MKNSVWFGVFLAGFSSMLTQIVVLREALSGFYGNELILGVVFANWLLLSGAGTYFGKRFGGMKDKLGVFSLTQVTLALVAPATVFFMRTLRLYFLTPGELVGFLPAVAYSFIVLLPFCLLSGFQFTLVVAVASERVRLPSFWASNVYVALTGGNLVGGLLFSFVLAYTMNSFQAVSLVVYSNLVSSALIAAAFRRKRLLILAAASLALSAVFLNVIDLSAISARLQYPGQELVLLKNSVYGSITITDTKGQLNFYENGFPLFSTENQQANEEKVHYAMLAHPAPRSVLLVSGGIAGTTSEILKYSPDRVDYVELDPALIEVGRNFTGSLDDGRVRVHSVDARVYVRETADRYDVVIMDLPDPSSIQVNRFYTREFLEDVKSVLNPDGVVSLHVSGGENYLSEESRKLNSAVYRTVASVFENVLVVPGSTNYYVSSDAHLDYDYASKLSGRGIKTKYFEYYLPGTLAEDRIAYMRSAVSGDSRLNTDFTPISSYYYMSYWMSLFRLDYNVVAVLVVLVLAGALYVSRIKPVPLSIFVIGFSAMALELILIFAFQVIHGYVYAKIGLIVTAFMLGNFIGAYTSNNMLRSSSVTARLLSKLNFIFFAYCLILPSILLRAAGFYNLSMFSPGFLIPSLTFVVGVFVGLAFPIAVKTYEKEASGAVDSASALASLDLFGACVGAMLATVVLIPLYGLIKVTLFVGLMNLASGLYIWFKEK